MIIFINTLLILQWIFPFVIFIRWYLIYTKFTTALDNNKTLDNISKEITVIIPLKGWDNSMDALLHNLQNQRFNGSIEILIIIDRSSIDNFSTYKENIIPVISQDLPDDWHDKNWRIYQGVCKASYKTILFLDSDVCIDEDYINRRLNTHKGELSFSLPIYASSSTSSEMYLAAFTNYNNLSIYAGGFIYNKLGTAIGPSMLVHPVDSFLKEVIVTNKKEIADDHALGYLYNRSGRTVSLSREPIVVTHDCSNWKSVFLQIIRWLILPRTIIHLLDKNILLHSICIFLLNLLIPVSVIIGCLISVFYSFSFIHFIPPIVLLFLEGVGVIVNQKKLLGAEFRLSLSHVLYVPLNIIFQPILVIISMFIKKLKWRGLIIDIKP